MCMFENDQKEFGCVGGCGYAPASVKNSSKLDTRTTCMNF